jgi:hypothetical protein
MSTSDAGGRTGSESRERRGSFRTLWLAWRVRDNEEHLAEDAASTLFRFFRSDHVGDLKLVAKLAIILLSLHVLLVLTYALTFPIAHFIANPAAHHSTADIIEHAFDVLFTRVFPSLFTYVGPAITIYGAIVAWSYLSASKRLGVVDLFACEISTLCRVGTIFDIGKTYVDMYHKGNATEKHAAAKHTASPQSFVSQEEYFPIFDHNSSDLESLEALVVESITEYYTYMKATRDLLRKLASIDVSHISKSGDSTPDGIVKVDPWHKTVADIIYVLFLGYESARKAITDLTEFQPTRTEHIVIILLTELVCYSFLCEYLKHDKVRFARLQLRQSDYESIVRTLIGKINAGYMGKQKKYWAPAQGTIPELTARYRAAIAAVQRCAIMNNSALREVSVTMRHNDKPTSAVNPGSTVMLEVQVQSKGLAPLRYSWTSPSAKIADSDTSSVALTLPASPQETVVFVEITDGEGGALGGSITIPLTNGSSLQNGPVLKILNDNGSL